MGKSSIWSFFSFKEVKSEDVEELHTDSLLKYSSFLDWSVLLHSEIFGQAYKIYGI